MAAEVISNSQNSEQPMNSSKSFQTTAPSKSDFLILQNKVLFGVGMRLIWDAYHNDEILRANLISNYIDSCSLHSESLEYFNKQSSESLLNTLFQQPSSAGALTSLDISHNALDSRGMCAVAVAAAACAQLQELDVSFNGVLERWVVMC